MKKVIYLICLSLITTGQAFSQIQDINIGTTANDGTGDPLRTAFTKTNANFDFLDARATASGTNTYTATISPAITSYVTGQRYFITFVNANTNSSVTINLNALGAKNIVKTGGASLSSGDIQAGQVVQLYYDGTNMQIVGDGGSGSAAATWGTITGTLSSQSDLNSALGAKQDLDSDLTAIAGASPSNDDIIQRKAGAWTNRTLAQYRVDLALVNDGITNGVTTVAPSENAVFDALALKADLASPALTGTPTAPTAAGSTNTTQIATTAFVKASSPKQYAAYCSDLTSAITTGTNKGFITVPAAFTITGVYAYVFTAQTSGSILTVDINENGTTILSTKLTIDNNETDSSTAATAAVISDTAIAANSRLTFDVDQVGSGATGLIVWIIGY
jgi:hypothetical protein